MQLKNHKDMKKIILIFGLFVFALFSYGQKGASNAVTVDTLQGAETVQFVLGTTWTQADQTLTVQALCANISGTSDGTLALQGSVDGTSYSFINMIQPTIGTASPQASLTGTEFNQLTITDGLVASWVLYKNLYRYYRITGVGTSSDTTKITIFYTWK